MNLNKKIYTGLACGLLLAPFSASVGNGISNMVSAADLTQNATITIHKVKTDDITNKTQNTGILDPQGLGALDKVEGVEFKLYNFTAEFLNLRKGNYTAGDYGTSSSTAVTKHTPKKAYDQIVSWLQDLPATDAAFTSGGQSAIQTGVTDSDGKYEFTNVSQGTSGSNKCYVFVETDTTNAQINGQPVTVSKSENTVITLPILKDADSNGLTYDEANNAISIYPKNEVADNNIEKHLVSDTNASTVQGVPTNGDAGDPKGVTAEERHIGEKVDFQVTVKFPDDYDAIFTHEDDYVDGQGNTQHGQVEAFNYAEFRIIDPIDSEMTFIGLTSIKLEGSQTELLTNNFTTDDWDTFDAGNDFSSSQQNYSPYQVNGKEIGLRYLNLGQVESGKVGMQLEMGEGDDAAGGAILPTASKQFRSLVAGKKVIFTISAIVNKNAIPDKAFNNKVRYGYHFVDEKNNYWYNSPYVQSEFVTTHGYSFIKLDGDNGAPLSGVDFVVTSNDGQSLYKENTSTDHPIALPSTYVNGVDPWVDVADVTDVTDEGGKGSADGKITASDYQKAGVEVFTSSNNGTFLVKGLRAGTYKIKEIKAKDNYILLSDPIDFVVANGTAADSDVATDTYNPNDGKHDILNYPEGTLPSTGGVGIVLFVVVGGLAAFFGITTLSKTRKETEEI